VSDPRAKEIVDGLAEAAPSDADRRASQVMVDALRAHRDSASGIAAVPQHDEQLSSKLMAEARSRSQEIRDASARRTEHPVPWWLWLAWLGAIGLFAAGWWFSWPAAPCWRWRGWCERGPYPYRRPYRLAG
jgi:hypothetical protein